MNKHIELVKKWISDSESVTRKELKDNSDEAATKATAYAADYDDAVAAYFATCAANKAALSVASNYAVTAYAVSVAANYAVYGADGADSDIVYYAAYARKWIKRYEEVLELCNDI
jgi:hypothetical protein